MGGIIKFCKSKIKCIKRVVHIFQPIFLNFSSSERTVTKQQFHSYYLHQRSNSRNFLLLAERLLQEYMCMSFVSVENQRLQYARNNQDILRAEVWASLQDAVSSSDGTVRAGKRVICPKSLYNSPRSRFCRYIFKKLNFRIYRNFALIVLGTKTQLLYAENIINQTFL